MRISNTKVFWAIFVIGICVEGLIQRRTGDPVLVMFGGFVATIIVSAGVAFLWSKFHGPNS